ncbi:MAG: TonB-dependent receptor [Pseudomonadota bacterium]
MEQQVEKATQQTPSRMTAFAAGIILSCLTSVVLAEVKDAVAISIAGDTLGEALDAFSEAYDVPVISAGGILEGKQSPRVSGRLTSEEALRQLLAGSGLSAERSSTGAVLISKATETEEEAVTRPATGDARSSTSSRIEEVLVYSSYYLPNTTTVGSRFPASSQEIAQSIQLLPRELFQAQGAFHISDVLVNISGGSTNRGLVGTYSPYRIRGQDAALIVNGNRNRFYDLEYALHTVERIEVLKGPASTFYGVQSAGGLGGVINLVTKRAEFEYAAKASVQFSDQGTRWGWVDVTGPLGDTGLAFRLLADVERSDTFVDNGFLDREGVAGSIRFDDGGRFRLALDADYRNRRNPFHVGLPQYGTIDGLGDLRLPVSRDIGEPAIPSSPFASGNGHRIENRMITAMPEYDINENWTIKATARYQERTIVENFGFPLGLRDDNRTLDRLLWVYPEDDEEYFGIVDLAGRFSWLGREHRVVFGVDAGSFRAESVDFIFGDLDPIDIENPGYGTTPSNVSSIGFTNYYSELDTRAAYINGIFTLTDRLKFSAGVRYDDIDQETDCDACEFAAADIDEVSPRLGFTYGVWEGISAFVGWGEAISPQLPSAGISEYVPETSEQFEVGVKLDLNRLSGSAAIFELERDGIQLNDPITFQPFFVGTQRTRGLDIDLAFEVRPNWALLANYAYMQSDTTADQFTPSNVGRRLPGVPKHSGRIWTQYEVRGGMLDGLSLLAGLTFASDRAGDVANSYFVDAYRLVDFGARYALSDSIALQLNVQNAFDERFFNPGTGFNEGFVTPGEPRTILGSIAVEF